MGQDGQRRSDTRKLGRGSAEKAGNHLDGKAAPGHRVGTGVGMRGSAGRQSLASVAKLDDVAGNLLPQQVQDLLVIRTTWVT